MRISATGKGRRDGGADKLVGIGGSYGGTNSHGHENGMLE